MEDAEDKAADTAEPTQEKGASAAPPHAPPGRYLDHPIPAEPLLCAEGAVRKEWVDYNNHMNVGYYLLVFDQALDAAYDDWLGFGAEYVARRGMGPFALQSHLHYLRELRLGEGFAIHWRLLDLDHKRIHYVLSMTRAEDGALAATCEQLSMNVSHNTRRSAPFPEETYRRFEAAMTAHRDLPRPDQIGQPIGIRRG